MFYNNNNLLLDRASALWVACNIGSTKMVHQILALEWKIRDDPSPDGTTAFAISLAKGNKDIVKLFLDSNVQPKNEMEALFKAANSSEISQSATIDKE
jgi:ankyrin repeat protein